VGGSGTQKESTIPIPQFIMSEKQRRLDRIRLFLCESESDEDEEIQQAPKPKPRLVPLARPQPEYKEVAPSAGTLVLRLLLIMNPMNLPI